MESSAAACLGIDTATVAVWYLDRVLSTTRVPSKYLRCMAAGCLSIACKICEEDEAVPTFSVLARDQWIGCTVSELIRMERVLLSRLSWNLAVVTPFTFIPMMLSMVFPGSSILSGCVLTELAPMLFALLENYQLVHFNRESCIALSLCILLMRKLHLSEELAFLKHHILDVMMDYVTEAEFETCYLSVVNLHCGSQSCEDGAVAEAMAMVDLGWLPASPHRRVGVRKLRHVPRKSSAPGFVTANRFQPLLAIGGTGDTPRTPLELISYNAAPQDVISQCAKAVGKKRQRVKSQLFETTNSLATENRDLALVKRLATSSDKLNRNAADEVGAGVMVS